MRWKRPGLMILLALGMGGCAGGVKPCMVIPAQLELARDEMNATRLEVDNKRRDVERWTNAVQQARTRLEKLQEERDQLRKEIGGEKVGEAKTDGSKAGVRAAEPVPATPKDGGKP